MTEREKEIRQAVAKIAYFQGGYELKLIDYIDDGVNDEIKFNLRDKINPELLKVIADLDALKFKEDLTIEEAEKFILNMIISHSDELRELRDWLNEIAEWNL